MFSVVPIHVLRFQAAIFLICAVVICLNPVVAEQRYVPWILVDTELNKIALMSGNNPVKTFNNVSIGRNGAQKNRLSGDQTTPVGEYTISWISDSKKYYKFFGINFPNLFQAKKALDEKKISSKTFSKIKKALDENRLPPQNTELGGNLGIHGLGTADASIHETFNWTNGCVAMTDKQMDQLAQYVQIGTLVIIR